MNFKEEEHSRESADKKECEMFFSASLILSSSIVRVIVTSVHASYHKPGPLFLEHISSYDDEHAQITGFYKRRFGSSLL